jgi:pantoate--beta-alanine ligase
VTAEAPVFFEDPSRASDWCAEAREQGKRLGFVPTMGALHAGHLALVERARSECDAVCVSIFVNPLQFDDPADLARYPRDLEGDRAALARGGCEMIFSGTLASFFPGRLTPSGGLDPASRIDPGAGALGLEGDARPGHFSGVATICARLFELVGAERAYFGQKDFQQCLVVRDLVRHRAGPRIVACRTVREASGLALSSRNARLSVEERERATGVYRALLLSREAWRAGERRARTLADGLREDLEQRGFALDYAAIRDPSRWTAEEPRGELERAVALVAVRMGSVRLLDNLLLEGSLEEIEP